jgi:hypothetical protein
MKETSDYLSNVNGIVNAARRFNPEIGSRIKHFYNENFQIAVLLTGNGTITIGLAYAQDGIKTMSNAEIQKIAETYRKV